MARWREVTEALHRLPPVSFLTLARDRSAAGLRSGIPGSVDQWCLARLGRALAGSPIRLQLWDGTGVDLAADRSIATIVIEDRATLLRLLIQPALEFGDAYASGHLSVHGDLVQMLESVNRALAGKPFQRRAPKGRSVSRTDARLNVQHYALGNEFYKLWLDDQMVYTCAYFERASSTLEEAQRAKLEYVCRKLELQPGQHVVEAGCGWGALALHMAREHGVTVTAYNVSEPQLAYARARATREGLDHLVTFIQDDYRSIDGHCDAFVSIGMLEHVGREQYATLGEVVDRVLDRERGRALLHFIGRNVPLEFNPWIKQRIFPGAYAPALGEVLSAVLQRQNFSVTDVENLRLHYARTLEEWLARFEEQVETVRGMFGDAFVRMWRLYLASAQACFRSGDLQLFQVTFARATDNSRPWTRDAWYAADDHGSL